MTKQKHDARRRRLTGASGTEALGLSFEALMTLLNFILGSIHHGVLYLLNGHHYLETSHLGRQCINL